ncbi:MAG: glycosyltransferase involved in cell wall biosynthesis [Verrucomicrobiales bacterium]|jgi:glycosyltransferase involved in cell wall biosynthesis
MSDDRHAAAAQIAPASASDGSVEIECAVLMPSFNTGPELLIRTVQDALAHWQPVWVVIDGSTDGSADALAGLGVPADRLRVLVLPENCGKGAAILHGLERAAEEGITHVITMDADGQHPANRIGDMIAQAIRCPQALVLGEPVFDHSAPSVRVKGRRISNWWANVETLWWGIHDSLFGFRVYPVDGLLHVMRSTRWARRFDFDAETAVRLCWRGLPVVNVAVPVRYLGPEEGGVSQFRYLRDNVLLTWMHARLMIGFFIRLPWLTLRKLRRPSR